MNKVRPSAHFERALFVVVVIAGAVGSAVWDIHGVASAIAAGKLAREGGVARRASPSPTAAASAASASRVVARLAP